MARGRVRLGGAGGEGKEERAWELPISMIDVVFLLLVFFMVVGRFRADEKVLEPKMAGGPPDGWVGEMIHLKVDAEGAGELRPVLTVRSRTFRGPGAFSALEAHLKGVARVNRGTPVVIRGSGEVPFWMVVSAFDAAMAARLKDVRFEAPRAAAGPS